ncbi:MAG: bifunctional nicotinamidase/pyrazinamidase [Cyclobacteriaceae bacterium]
MIVLILVDLQYDFLPGGALAVPEGDKIIPLVNQLQSQFDLIVATQDWHPAEHQSFASQHPGKQVGEEVDLQGLPQVLWPDHCIDSTHGAALSEELKRDKIKRIFRKGTDPEIDSYSGFFDNGHKKATGLGDYLKEQGVDKVFIVGLATDYCVKYTALDAAHLGFETTVITDATKGVNLQPGDSDVAMKEMEEKGVRLITSQHIL